MSSSETLLGVKERAFLQQMVERKTAIFESCLTEFRGIKGSGETSLAAMLAEEHSLRDYWIVVVIRRLRRVLSSFNNSGIVSSIISYSTSIIPISQ